MFIFFSCEPFFFSYARARSLFARRLGVVFNFLSGTGFPSSCGELRACKTGMTWWWCERRSWSLFPVDISSSLFFESI